MASDYEFVNSSGVQFELVFDKKTEVESIVITIPTYLLKKPTKETALREEKVKGKSTGFYVVPKSDSFVAETKKLKSGHVVMLQIYRKLADELRHRLYKDGAERGLKVHPIDLGEKGEIEIEDSGVIRTKL